MRVIPIALYSNAVAPRADECDEASGQVTWRAIPFVRRRKFLKGSCVRVETFATGSVLALLALSPVWAFDLIS